MRDLRPGLAFSEGLLDLVAGEEKLQARLMLMPRSSISRCLARSAGSFQNSGTRGSRQKPRDRRTCRAEPLRCRKTVIEFFGQKHRQVGMAMRLTTLYR